MKTNKKQLKEVFVNNIEPLFSDGKLTSFNQNEFRFCNATFPIPKDVEFGTPTFLPEFTSLVIDREKLQTVYSILF